MFTPLTWNGHLVLVADGLKVGKEGKKMPAVKKLHQESDNNNKASWIMGHSLQVVSMLAKGCKGGIFAVPLAGRIHEGIKFSNRDKRTLLDKLVGLFGVVTHHLKTKSILVADAYYASKKVVLPLLEAGHQLLTRVKHNTVAFEEPPKVDKPKKGRPRKYGKKLFLKKLFDDDTGFDTAPSPVYGEKNVQIRFKVLDLLWRPVGRMVRFILVDNPNRGKIILMTSCLTLPALDAIALFGYRFKIEVSFKQALRTVETFSYHFWMKLMDPIRRNSGTQHLHTKPMPYRQAVLNKMDAYHRYIQLGCVAQGLLQYLALSAPIRVWAYFKSWMRTMNTDREPSEMVVAQALRASLPDFLLSSRGKHALEKIFIDHADMKRFPSFRLCA